MRIEVSVTDAPEGDGWRVSLHFGQIEIVHGMRRVSGALPVAPNPERVSNTPPSILDRDPQRRETIATNVAKCTPETGEVELIGRYLFDALIGKEAWARIMESVASTGGDLVELALCWRAGDSDLNTPRWELMHDGRQFLAALRERRVAITRVVADAPAATASLEPIAAPVRVLFVIGSDLNSRGMRPGAEVMGLLRRIEDDRSAVIPFILERASVRRLSNEVRRVRPDIVHFITHGRVERGRGQVVLHDEDSDTGFTYVGAEALLEALSGEDDTALPRLAVVTACESATARDHTVPLATELVSGGIAIVVGMTGVVSDPVCRLFSNRFGAAVTQGKPLVRALTDGRRAALLRAAETGEGPETQAEWALPALFLAPWVETNHIVVDNRGIDELRKRIGAYGLQQLPVFCGRREFIRLLDRLLDNADYLNVLVASVERSDDGKVGETRLLHELARRALRTGHLVMMISNGGSGAASEPPATPGLLALYLVQELLETRRRFGLPPLLDSVVLNELSTAANDERLSLDPASDEIYSKFDRYWNSLKERHDEWKDKFQVNVLHEALAVDLQRLERDARASKDPLLAEDCRVIVMLEGIEKWGETTKALTDTILTPSGIGAGNNHVPVFVTCTVTDSTAQHTLTELQERSKGETWVHVEHLQRFREPEDTLAYQWMLLNTYPGANSPHSEKVYVRAKPTDEWIVPFREHIKGFPSHFGKPFYMIASTLSYSKILISDVDDEAKMAAYTQHNP